MPYQDGPNFLWNNSQGMQMSDLTWISEVVQDLRVFAVENGLPESAKVLRDLEQVLEREAPHLEGRRRSTAQFKMLDLAPSSRAKGMFD